MRNDPTPFLLIVVSMNMLIVSMLLLFEDEYEVTVESVKVTTESEPRIRCNVYKTIQCVPRKENDTIICGEWIEVSDNKEEEVQY